MTWELVQTFKFKKRQIQILSCSSVNGNFEAINEEEEDDDHER